MLHFCRVRQECTHFECGNPSWVAEVRRELCCSDEEGCQWELVIPCQLAAEEQAS